MTEQPISPEFMFEEFRPFWHLYNELAIVADLTTLDRYDMWGIDFDQILANPATNSQLELFEQKLESLYESPDIAKKTCILLALWEFKESGKFRWR